MRVILRPRGNGKTRVAVETFLEDSHSVLIVVSPQERERILNEYAIPVKRRSHIISCEGAAKALRGTSRRIIVDNADVILQILLRTYEPIEMMTVNGGASVPIVEETNVEPS